MFLKASKYFELSYINKTGKKTRSTQHVDCLQYSNKESNLAWDQCHIKLIER